MQNFKGSFLNTLTKFEILFPHHPIKLVIYFQWSTDNFFSKRLMKLYFIFVVINKTILFHKQMINSPITVLLFHKWLKKNLVLLDQQMKRNFQESKFLNDWANLAQVSYAHYIETKWRFHISHGNSSLITFFLLNDKLFCIH